MQEKSKEPEIRFAGFTGAWEQRKLSDGMTEYTDRVFIEDDQIYKQVTVKNTGEISLRGSQPGRNIGRKRQARVNLRDYPMTLIFTRQTVEQGGIGFAKNDVDGCIVTENMPTIAVDGKKFNQDFLVAFFKTYGFRKDVILSNIEGGTAQIAIHEDDILDSSSTFPSLKEQIKIGNFFRTLSQQITLHQRKYEKLLNIKKSMLEKMFPKEGEVVPEIRFKGFTGAWEQRKLGELYEKAGSGGTPNASNASFYSGTIPFLGISDIKGRYITKTAKHISEKGLKSSAAWMVPSGAISLAMYASVGKVGITTVELATSQAFYNMVFASSSLRNFIFSRLEKSSDNDEWLPLVSTGTQSNLNADKIKNWCISVPNPDEQKLVGDFFKTLDSLLTLHQRKLEMLKNVKQAFLEKMFV